MLFLIFHMAKRFLSITISRPVDVFVRVIQGFLNITTENLEKPWSNSKNLNRETSPMFKLGTVNNSGLKTL